MSYDGSGYLADAARALHEAHELTMASTYTKGEKTAALLRISHGYATLAAIDKGLILPPLGGEPGDVDAS